MKRIFLPGVAALLSFTIGVGIAFPLKQTRPALTNGRYGGKITEITLERNGTWWGNPVRTITFRRNGLTTINRETYPDYWVGGFDNCSRFDLIAQLIEKEGFFDMKESYGDTTVAMGSFTLTVTRNGRSKRVTTCNYVGSPPQLLELAAIIDSSASTGIGRNGW